MLSQHTHPNPDSGFGRVNLAHSIGTVHGDDGAGFFEGQVDDTSQMSVSNNITASHHHTKLKVTLVWSDPYGENIQNSLLLTVEDATGTKCRGDDDNNAQQVLWDGISSQDLTITVESLGLTKLPQAFAVAWQFS
ncbi:hypothetical protein L207DRAFT_583381 [Hyaloscypha variabilis F]|uniref:Reelin domain-containing protein n=1 Tax=Hyaloscypha variabilis (strain UAMH 11265 / GT02V1 / F) TaxID=1149755 RepID=A0A2J6RLW2_HYAVF|nr:hypothetical protein L207DRAFT_583381 [Hyaloscypha variabilis F]